MIKHIIMPIVTKLPPYESNAAIHRAHMELTRQQAQAQEELNTLLNAGYSLVLSERIETPDESDILILLYKPDRQPMSRTTAIDELLDEDRED